MARTWTRSSRTRSRRSFWRADGMKWKLFPQDRGGRDVIHEDDMTLWKIMSAGRAKVRGSEVLS